MRKIQLFTLIFFLFLSLTAFAQETNTTPADNTITNASEVIFFASEDYVEIIPQFSDACEENLAYLITAYALPHSIENETGHIRILGLDESDYVISNTSLNFSLGNSTDTYVVLKNSQPQNKTLSVSVYYNSANYEILEDLSLISGDCDKGNETVENTAPVMVVPVQEEKKSSDLGKYILIFIIYTYALVAFVAIVYYLYKLLAALIRKQQRKTPKPLKEKKESKKITHDDPEITFVPKQERKPLSKEAKRNLAIGGMIGLLLLSLLFLASMLLLAGVSTAVTLLCVFLLLVCAFSVLIGFFLGKLLNNYLTEQKKKKKEEKDPTQEKPVKEKVKKNTSLGIAKEVKKEKKVKKKKEKKEGLSPLKKYGLIAFGLLFLLLLLIAGWYYLFSGDGLSGAIAENSTNLTNTSNVTINETIPLNATENSTNISNVSDNSTALEESIVGEEFNAFISRFISSGCLSLIFSSLIIYSVVILYYFLSRTKSRGMDIFKRILFTLSSVAVLGIILHCIFIHAFLFTLIPLLWLLYAILLFIILYLLLSWFDPTEFKKEKKEKKVKEVKSKEIKKEEKAFSGLTLEDTKKKKKEKKEGTGLWKDLLLLLLLLLLLCAGVYYFSQSAYDPQPITGTAATGNETASENTTDLILLNETLENETEINRTLDNQTIEENTTEEEEEEFIPIQNQTEEENETPEVVVEENEQEDLSAQDLLKQLKDNGYVGDFPYLIVKPGETKDVNLSGYFYDLDEDELFFSVRNKSSDDVSVSIWKEIATVKVSEQSDEIMTVTFVAEDPYNAEVEGTMTVVVDSAQGGALQLLLSNWMTIAIVLVVLGLLVGMYAVVDFFRYNNEEDEEDHF